MQTGIPDRTQTTVSPDSGPIVLLETRFMHGDITSSADSDEGLIIWIGATDEEQTKGNPDS